MSVGGFVAGKRLNRTTSLPAWNAFTITGWMYITTVSSATYHIPMSFNDNALANFVAMGYDNHIPNDWRLYTTAGQALITSPPTGEWLFWAVTQNDTTAFSGWARIGDTSFTSGTVAASGAFTPTFLSLGNPTDDFGPLLGQLAWVKVWNRTLTTAQLLLEKNTGRPYDLTNINTASPLTGPGDVRDYSGNGRDWTVVGTGLQQVAGPSIGSGGDFSGV